MSTATAHAGGMPGGASARRLAASPALRVGGRRLLAAIPVLWGVTFLTYLVMNALPGDAAEALLGANATPAEVRAFRIKLHLNEPLFTRYGHWLAGVVTGNLGTSLESPQSVASVLGQRLPVTLELVVYALVVTFIVSIPLAVLCARRPRGIIDRLSMVLSMGSISVAPYVLGLLVIIVFSVELNGVFPATYSAPTGIGSNLYQYTAPSVVLAVPLIGFYTRFLRADLLEQMQTEDYVTTARAKGVSEWRILTRHALRNSFIGLLTVIGLNLATLIGATVIVETIWELPGIGQQLIHSISNRDVPVIEGIVLVFGIVVVLANLVTDLLYGVLDPRIRHVRSRS